MALNLESTTAYAGLSMLDAVPIVAPMPVEDKFKNHNSIRRWKSESARPEDSL